MEGMESSPLTGRLLVASPLLADPNFLRSVVLVLQHDADGAAGLVLNRPSTALVEGHLPQWAAAAADPALVFMGGPVEPEVGIGLALRSGDQVGALQGVGLIDLELVPSEAPPVRIFSGYAGWGPGQLEDEMREGAWLLADADPSDAFHPQPERLWSEVLRRQGGPVAMLSTYPFDPGLN